jgi:hypothetical protein
VGNQVAVQMTADFVGAATVAVAVVVGNQLA